jgi:hypothetical protein
LRRNKVLRRNIAPATKIAIVICDEALTFPPPSTAESGDGGKVGLCRLDESPDRAQLQGIGTARIFHRIDGLTA